MCVSQCVCVRAHILADQSQLLVFVYLNVCVFFCSFSIRNWKFSVRSIILAAVCITVAVVWGVYRNEDRYSQGTHAHKIHKFNPVCFSSPLIHHRFAKQCMTRKCFIKLSGKQPHCFGITTSYLDVASSQLFKAHPGLWSQSFYFHHRGAPYQGYHSVIVACCYLVCET